MAISAFFLIDNYASRQGTTDPSAAPRPLPPPAPRNVQTYRCFDFTNTCGITDVVPPNGNWTLATQAVKYIGAMHGRDGIITNNPPDPNALALSRTGFGFWCAPGVNCSGGEWSRDIAHTVAAFEAFVKAGGVVDFMEGPNEVNDGCASHDHYKGTRFGSDKDLANACQRQMFNAVRGSSVLTPVSSSAGEIGGLGKHQTLVASASLINNGNNMPRPLTTGADVGNWHVYPAHGVSQAFYLLLNNAPSSGGLGWYVAGKPQISGEVGWTSTWDNGNLLLPYQGALWLCRCWIGFIAAGIEFLSGNSICIQSFFSLYNSTGEDYWWFTNDNTPRGLAVCVHNLISVLRDTGSTAKTFRPPALPISFVNMPSGNSGTFVLTKSNGNVYAVAWNEDYTSGTTVTVDLGATYKTVNVYDTSANVKTTTAADVAANVPPAPVHTVSSASSVNITVTGWPMIVEAIPPTVPL